MSLKKSKGNMYNWVDFMHCHLAGECPHKCSYCYVDSPRFGRPKRYTGPLRLIEDEFKVKYGSGKTIFIEHLNDLFAEDIPNEFIERIHKHCREWRNNTYIFQTKNPRRYTEGKFCYWPPSVLIGTTIETNRNTREISNAPAPCERFSGMLKLPDYIRKFLTIEPILDFDIEILTDWIERIRPEFVNIGADSKGYNLPEPAWEKVEDLITRIAKMGIEIREKHNLERLKAR